MCLQIARDAKNGNYAPRVGVIYDEIMRKEMAERSEKNDPEFWPNDTKRDKVDKHMLERAIKMDADRGLDLNKGKGKGKDDGKGKGKTWSKGQPDKGHGKGHGKYDNRQNRDNGYENRGEKRTLPWQKGHYDNKKWKGGGQRTVTKQSANATGTNGQIPSPTINSHEIRVPAEVCRVVECAILDMCVPI